MTGRLAGKAAIVTGAGLGIGRASAKTFAREGARVLCVDRAEDGLRQTLAEIEAAGGKAAMMTADAGDENDVKAYIAKAQKDFGALDVVYANAGISGDLTALFDVTVDMFTEILRINLIGPFLAIRHAAPLMIAKGAGSIICSSSVSGLRANAGIVPYSASKAGVNSLAQTAANALIGTGVRVNAICPGVIETGMTAAAFSQTRERGPNDAVDKLNPLQRAGVPQEIANMALFLASDEASYVNGQAFAVDGGWSSSVPYARPRK